MFEVAVDDAAERGRAGEDFKSGAGDAEKGFAREVLRFDGRARREAMPLRKKDAKRFVDEVAELKVRGAVFLAKKGRVHAVLRDGRGELRRILRRDDDVDAGELFAEETKCSGQPRGVVTDHDAEREGWLGGDRRKARGLHGGFGLGEHGAGVIEEDAAGGSELDAAAAAEEQRGSDLLFEIADLPAQRGLSGVEHFFGGEPEAACLGYGDEIAEMSEFQGASA